MNMLESLGYKRIEKSALSWWASKSQEEKITLETYGAILAPAAGFLLGMLIVLAV
tara:strand:- start:92 stop:256 length:165 start_codon:yes stop_codon:yes gene_type:complete